MSIPDTLCIRGCTHPTMYGDTEPIPKLADVGLLCRSDVSRIEHALSLVPDLMANMRSQVSGTAAYRFSERVSGGGDGSPAPLRIGPLDAVDGLYAKLARWIDTIADALGHRAPTLPSWRTEDGYQGSASISVEGMLTLATEMSAWLTVRVPDIAALPLAVDFHDELAYTVEYAGPGVFALDALYGVEARRARPRECRECGHRSVEVNTLASGELLAKCSRFDCGHEHIAHEPSVTITDAARATGASRTTVANAVKSGRLAVDDDGRVSLSEARRVLGRYEVVA